jgi:protein-L-isoaspartate(D-aspartate) O-methyltransferase
VSLLSGFFVGSEADGQDYTVRRERLVAEVDAMYAETQRETGLARMSPEVRKALGKVERHRFVPRGQADLAYRNQPLPIGGGQTISQPWVQARYLELAALTGRERVLEVGAGSGYQTALLAVLADAVFAVERIANLAQSARTALEAAGLPNVTVLVGDGTLGWRPFAPYDAILVAAASPEIPAPLLEQLAPGGRLIIPLGDRTTQVLTLAQRVGDEVRTSTVADVRFVPLLGEFGFR